METESRATHKKKTKTKQRTGEETRRNPMNGRRDESSTKSKNKSRSIQISPTPMKIPGKNVTETVSKKSTTKKESKTPIARRKTTTRQLPELSAVALLRFFSGRPDPTVAFRRWWRRRKKKKNKEKKGYGRGTDLFFDGLVEDFGHLHGRRNAGDGQPLRRRVRRQLIVKLMLLLLLLLMMKLLKLLKLLIMLLLLLLLMLLLLLRRAGHQLGDERSLRERERERETACGDGSTGSRNEHFRNKTTKNRCETHRRLGGRQKENQTKENRTSFPFFLHNETKPSSTKSK